MRGLIPILALGLAGCATSAPPSPIFNPVENSLAGEFAKEHELEQQHSDCLTAEFHRVWSGEYAGTGDVSPTSVAQLTNSAIDSCIPEFGSQSEEVRYAVRSDIRQMAMRIDFEEKTAWAERRQKVFAAKAAENRAKLKAEEPTIAAAWRDCTIANARQLAQMSQESAEAIARAALSACQRERQNLIDLHQRYEDAVFDSQLMDELERRWTSKLMLEVMQTRMIRSAPELPTKPPVPAAGSSQPSI